MTTTAKVKDSSGLKKPTQAFQVWETSLQQIQNSRNSHKSNETASQFSVSDMNTTRRLLIVSSKCKLSSQLPKAVRSCISLVLYQYENNSLEDLIGMITTELNGTKVRSIAFIADGTESEIYLTANRNEVVSVETIFEHSTTRDFFCALVDNLDKSANGARLDFLACQMAQKEVGELVVQELRRLTKCHVELSKDMLGSDTRVIVVVRGVEEVVPVGGLYFIPQKLKDMMYGHIESHSHLQNMFNYEKIRKVGSGAFGTAVLYRNINDDSLVIWKEINMLDLNSWERQLSLNEVKVLSMLSHPNIICYYDSFEEDGVLMIKMEYADGGTLAQYLSSRKTRLEEKEIVHLFHQIVSAIHHMHEHNILHRDLKTSNIFLTKDGLVKVGDFGISKMLTTRQGKAHTLLGTPYYISPEMCQGKPYNEKSDIWALGCILHEMACLQKTFEGSTLPALVSKIVKGQFAPIRGDYSNYFKQIVKDLLQKDPEYRPTAKVVLHYRLPELNKQFEPTKDEAEEDTEVIVENQRQTNMHNPLRNLRSVLYRVKLNELDISLSPVPLPPRSRIKEVAVSSTHMIGLTYDLMAYTWGEGKKGQLGHGSLEPWLAKPKCVEALKDKNITKVCAGEGFSVFSSDNGIVMTCGDGSQGCLGYGGWNSSSKPKLVEKLLSVDVLSVTCGPHHVVVVSGGGVAYAWGCGSLGRLGTGNEDDCSVPTKVHLPENTTAIKAFCGSDGTMFVTDMGVLLACGSNLYNKLGLTERRMFLVQVKQLMVKNEIYKWLIPTRVNCLRNKVVSVSMGPTHTVVLLEQGKIITFGNNQDGQLGHGHIQNSLTPKMVKLMADKYIVMAQCGSTFTVATTINTVYFWGGRQVLSTPTLDKDLERHYEEDPIIDSLKTFNPASHHEKKDKVLSIDDNETSETSVSEVIKIGQSNTPLIQEVERVGPDASILHVKTPESRFFYASDSAEQHQNTKKIVPEKKDIILQPHEILALYASQAQVARGEIISLSEMYCSGNRLYLVVDTTLPLRESNNKKRNAKQEQRERTKYTSSTDGSKNIGAKISDRNHHAMPEISSDSLGLTPNWLKKELEGPVIPDMAGFSLNDQKEIEREKPATLIEVPRKKAWRNITGASERNSLALLHPSTSLVTGPSSEDTDSASCINNEWKKSASQADYNDPAGGMTRLRSSRIPINIIYFNSEHRSSSSPRPLRSCSLAYSKRCSTNSSDIITQNILDHFILTNSLHTVNNVRANKETNVYSCTGIAVTPASGRIRHSPLLYCWRCLVQELPVSCLQCKRVSPAKAQLGIHPSEVIIRNEKEQLALNTKQMEERMQELENESFQQMSQLEKWGKIGKEEYSVKIEVSELKKELTKQKLLLRENQEQINKFQDQLKILECQQNLHKEESRPASHSLSKPCKSSKICSIL